MYDGNETVCRYCTRPTEGVDFERHLCGIDVGVRHDQTEVMAWGERTRVERLTTRNDDEALRPGEGRLLLTKLKTSLGMIT